jgi:TM2 domain-containing membrane protein YozV
LYRSGLCCVAIFEVQVSGQATKRAEEAGAAGYLALIVAWLVPGMGHLMIGQKARGVIFAVTLHGLFALGLLIGGIRAINPADQPIWRYTQFLSGWPMLVSNHLEKTVFEPTYVEEDQNHQIPINRLYESNRPSVVNDGDRPARIAYAKDFIQKYPLFSYHPKIQDIGSVYCGLAGMLNLLVVFDVLLRITGAERIVPGKPNPPGAVSAAVGDMK